MKNHTANLTYFDIEPGDEFLSPSRTISESDIIQFAGLTGDLNELHTSEVFAESTQFKKRIAHGMLVLSMANGLYMRSNIFNSSVFLGIKDWKSTAPVYIGHTIRLKLTILSKRPTKDGKRGIIVMQYNVINQDNLSVAQGEFTRMVYLPVDR